VSDVLSWPIMWIRLSNFGPHAVSSPLPPQFSTRFTPLTTSLGKTVSELIWTDEPLLKSWTSSMNLDPAHRSSVLSALQPVGSHPAQQTSPKLMQENLCQKITHMTGCETTVSILLPIGSVASKFTTIESSDYHALPSLGKCWRPACHTSAI